MHYVLPASLFPTNPWEKFTISIKGRKAQREGEKFLNNNAKLAVYDC